MGMGAGVEAAIAKVVQKLHEVAIKLLGPKVPDAELTNSRSINQPPCGWELMEHGVNGGMNPAPVAIPNFCSAPLLGPHQHVHQR